MLDVIIIVGTSVLVLIYIICTNNPQDETQEYEIELTARPRISVEYNGLQYVPPEYI